jgi:hypothetical protein
MRNERNLSDSASALSTGKKSRRRLGWAFGTAIGIALSVYVVRGVLDAREAARQMNCKGHLGQIQLALHNYHDTFGCFPPAFIADANGKPMHSWRVLILPFLDSSPVYSQYRFDEPWDGPNNRKLAEQYNSDIFHCPSGPHTRDSVFTDYVAVVGPGTAFPDDKSTNLTEFQDGVENTILLVEMADSNIHWMEPRDLRSEEMSYLVNDPARPSISSPHPQGPAVVFADEIRAYRLRSSVRTETLKALTTIGGQEPVLKDRLVRSDSRFGQYIAE